MAGMCLGLNDTRLLGDTSSESSSADVDARFLGVADVAACGRTADKSGLSPRPACATNVVTLSEIDTLFWRFLGAEFCWRSRLSWSTEFSSG